MIERVRKMLTGGDGRDDGTGMPTGELLTLLDDGLRRDIVRAIDERGPTTVEYIELVTGVELGEAGGRLIMMERLDVVELDDGVVRPGERLEAVAAALDELDRRCV
jgi:hypothetical protein